MTAPFFGGGAGFGGGITPQGPPAPQSEPERKRSIFDRVGSVLERLAGVPSSGLLSEEERGEARRRGLLALGSTVLQHPGVGVGPAFGQGIMNAQQAAAGGVQDIQGLMAQRLGEEKLARRQQIFQQFQGQDLSDPKVLQNMFGALIQSGDFEGAAPVAEVLKVSRPPAGELVKGSAAPGEPEQYFLVNPRTGDMEPLEVFPRPTGQRVSNALIKMQNPDDPNGAPLLVRDSIDPTTGEKKLVPATYQGRLARGVSFPGDKERQAAGFNFFLGDAERAFDAFVDEAPGRLESFFNRAGARELVGADLQAMNIAASQYAEAWLRLTTGAAYNDTEFNNAVAMFTPQSGNPKSILRMKAANRAALREVMKSAAGRAAFLDAPDRRDAPHESAPRLQFTPLDEPAPGEGDERNDELERLEALGARLDSLGT
jgi:hypothetical protein